VTDPTPRRDDSLIIEIDKLRIRASGRFAVIVAAILAGFVVAGRWFGIW
jgi:hypothetical protein